MLEDLEVCLRPLDERALEVLFFTYVRRFQGKEIAHILECSAASVSNSTTAIKSVLRASHGG